MKITFFTSVFSFITIGLFAQTSLTYQNNALLTGNTYTFNEIHSPHPGNAGTNQIWDRWFSKPGKALSVACRMLLFQKLRVQVITIYHLLRTAMIIL